MAKNPLAGAGGVRDVDSIPGWGRSHGGGHSNPLQLFLPGKSHAQRRLVATVHGVTELLETGGKLRKNVFMENDDRSVSLKNPISLYGKGC